LRRFSVTTPVTTTEPTAVSTNGNGHKREPLLLTAGDVGELFQCEAETVRNLHRFGTLRAVKIGRELRWRPGDVERFVAELEQEKA
jgi:hypothetical protein